MIWEVRPDTLPSAGASAPVAVLVHESRLLLFKGVRVSRRQVIRNSGHGDSIFVRVAEVVRDFQATWQAAGVLLQDFSQAVMKVKGLAEACSADESNLIETRARLIDTTRSVARMILIDSEEEFERKATPMSGMPEMLEKLMLRVASAASMPVFKLFGQSPSGLNASGESNTRDWYDTVAAAQKTQLLPALKKLVTILLMSKDGPSSGALPDKWAIAFCPLWQPSEMESAEARKVQADIDHIYLTDGVVSPDDVSTSRFSGDEYSFDTVIDLEAKEAVLAADPTLATDPAAPALAGAPAGQDLQTSTDTVLNGAQITAAVAIVTSVAAGQLPRDTGVSMIKVFFNLTPEVANQIMGSAGTSTPTTPNPGVNPEPTPATPAPPTALDEKSDGINVDVAAAGRRAALVEKLGGKCVDCGKTDRLEFDHKKARTWVAAGLSHAQRIENYEKDAVAGNIVLRCRVCNAEKGKP